MGARPEQDQTSGSAEPLLRAADTDSRNHVEHPSSEREKEGYDPGPLFDPDWYLRQNPEAQHTGLSPLEHYLRHGSREGRSPHPLFDPHYYRKMYSASMLDCVDPLQHYLKDGWKIGFKPNPNFDPQFYLSTYPDIAAAGVEPFTHFVLEGLQEGRTGNPKDLRIEPFQADYRISSEPQRVDNTPDPKVKAIAFYLPQFHPIPENDQWWGKGFTEWTNVRRATPQFEGHYQPHVPVLGYYDLRDPKVLDIQVDLARKHGVYGFAFYYYWFHGKVLLDLPIRRMLATGRPDFPFCISWANESWTRRWDGMENDILISQKHSPEDDLAFIRNIEPILLHKNYIRVDEKPLLLVYRANSLPNAKETIARWRDYFRAQGHGELYLISTRTFQDTTAPFARGFDAAVQFPPHTESDPYPVNHVIANKTPAFDGPIYDYGKTKAVFLKELLRAEPSDMLYPGVMPSWDNSARRLTKAHLWVNSSPESYYDWLAQAVDYLRNHKPLEQRLVFINAWNEWAEGCHLEPDTKYGYAWLNATRLALVPEALAVGGVSPKQDSRLTERAIRLPLQAGQMEAAPCTQGIRGGRDSELHAPPDHYNHELLPVTRSGLHSATRSNMNGRVAVHVHAYYVDKLPTLLEKLGAIPVSHDLFISTNTEAKARHIAALLGTMTWPYSSVQIEVCPNRGRDVGPFIIDFGKRLLNYSYALHIHTKKCEYNETHGASWLNHNLDHLLHSPEYVSAILDLFERDSTQGVLLPIPYPGVASWMEWGGNRETTCNLLARLNIPQEYLDSMPLYFPAGTMFWFRPSALSPLLESEISWEDFPPEPIPIDGTLAHAVERCILYVAKYMDYSYTTISPSGM
jgi:lipopolysaccharide biosynthesis protein